MLVDRVISGSDQMIVSRIMLKRLKKVLKRPYFATRLGPGERHVIVRRYRGGARTFQPNPSIVGFAADAEDDSVLGTAVAGRADVIVTGDKGLLALHPFRGIAVLTARDVLDLIDA